jgi:hypothetical protein
MLFLECVNRSNIIIHHQTLLNNQYFSINKVLINYSKNKDFSNKDKKLILVRLIDWIKIWSYWIWKNLECN